MHVIESHLSHQPDKAIREFLTFVRQHMQKELDVGE